MADFPNVAVVLAAALAGVVDVRSKRESGDPLPSAQIRRASGGDDGLSDTARVGVSVFADSEIGVIDVGKTVAKAISDLAPRFGPQTPVTTEAGPVWVDAVRFIERFRPEDHAEPNVYKQRAIVELTIRLQ